MTDLPPLHARLYESTPEEIAEALRYLAMADAVAAALTRQPVAGESHCVACGESSCKGINFCEPAATPTDGGEGS